MLHEFLESKRSEILARSQEKHAVRGARRATEPELEHGIALFLDQLIEIMKRSKLPSAEMNESATKHGNEMLRLGFGVGQVVHDYGDVCQAVTELAFELDAPITVDEFRTLNRCVDDAIAQAVSEYARMREKSQSDRETERLGFLAHELRNRLSTALLSFGILKGGEVSIKGSTGALLEGSLKALNNLIDRSLTEVRLASAAHARETVLVAEFVEEIEIAAMIEAKARGHQLTVEPVEYGIAIEVDRQLLGAAVANLLQNAFKFTHQLGHVWLRTRATTDRVFIEVEDECGGLPPGQAEALFRPFEQRSTDRSGLGLGLSIVQKAVHANGGETRVSNIAGKGCIFTVDLPRRAT